MLGIKVPSLSIIFKYGIYLSYGFAGSGTVAFDNGAGGLFETRVANAFKSETFTHAGNTYTYTPFRQWDYGALLGVDFLYKRFTFRIIGSFGALNIHSEYDKQLRNQMASLSVAYTL
jgi:hypothetical protein